MDKRNLNQLIIFIVPFAALIWSFFCVSEEQIASLLGLSVGQANESVLLLNRMSNCFRVLIFLLFMCLCLVFSYFSIKYKCRDITIDSNMDSPENQIKVILKYIENTPEVQSIKIWGYSLNWASAISAYIADNPRRSLIVKLYIPDLAIMETLCNDDSIKGRKGLLDHRLDEWKRLNQEKLIKSLELYYQNTIPNELGLIVDENIGFWGMYNWELDKYNNLKFRRVEEGKRFRFVFNKNNNYNSSLLNYMNQKMICREKDSKCEIC